MTTYHPSDIGGPDGFPTYCAGAHDMTSSWCDPIVSDDELASWNETYRVTDGRKVDPTFARIEAERWERAYVKPIGRRGNDEGSSGLAWASPDAWQAIDLERAADAWLMQADYPIERPDTVADTHDPMTLLDYTRHDVKPDRVAYRGAQRARVVTHQRDERNGRTISTNNGRAWVDTARHEPIIRTAGLRTNNDGHPTAAPIYTVAADGTIEPSTSLSIPLRKISTIGAWKRTRASDAARKAKRNGNGPDVTEATPTPTFASDVQIGADAPLPMLAGSASETAAYGRPVTPWTCAARSLPRIMARASDEVRRIAAEWAEILTSEVATFSIAGHEVNVTGSKVDDGRHGTMPVRDWARRAALAGIDTID